MNEIQCVINIRFFKGSTKAKTQMISFSSFSVIKLIHFNCEQRIMRSNLKAKRRRSEEKKKKKICLVWPHQFNRHKYHRGTHYYAGLQTPYSRQCSLFTQCSVNVEIKTFFSPSFISLMRKNTYIQYSTRERK